MKQNIKILFIALMVGITFHSFSQSNFEAGLRFGDQPGNEVAIDITVPISAAPRLHPALYLGNGGIAMGAYFDWLFGLEGGPNGLKLYPGVGPEIDLFNGFELGVAGNFGVEYTFDFPLTVGIDWRPRFVVTDAFAFQSNNIGLNVRFWFKGLKRLH